MADVTELEDLAAIKHFQMNNDKLLMKHLLLGLEFFQDPYVRKIMDLKSPMNLPKYVANKAWRPINTGVENSKTPQGVFSQRTISPKTIMKILEIIPEQFRSTYFASQLDPNAKEYPAGFAQFFWEAQNRQGADEINDNIYYGKDPDTIPAYNSASTYVAGNIVYFTKSDTLGKQFFKANSSVSATQTPLTHASKWDDADVECLAKGWGTIIAAEYSTLPAAQKIATGAIIEATAVEQWQDYHFSLPEKLRNKTVIHFCSQNTWDAYKLKYAATYDKDIEVVNNRGNISAYIRSTDNKGVIHPVSWMHGSGRIISGPPEMLTVGTNMLSDMTSFGKQVDTLHGYKTIQKAILAFEIADTECLYVNDQA